MSKRSRPIKSKEVTSERSRLPWFDAPQEIIELIHSNISHDDIHCLFNLLRVSKNHYRYIMPTLRLLSETIVNYRYNKPEHNFPLSKEWQLVAHLYEKGIGPKIAKHEIMVDLVTFIETNSSSLCDDLQTIMNILYLLKVIAIIAKYKPIQEKPHKGENWAKGTYKIENIYIPVGTQLCYIYRYDKELDKCVNIRKESRVKRIINMPTHYGSKPLLRALVTDSKIPLTEKELLFHSIDKPAVEYTHCMAYMTLGKNVNHAKPSRNTAFKSLAVQVEGQKDSYLHIYASLMTSFRSQYFLSAYANAGKALLEYKAATFPQKLLTSASAFLIGCKEKITVSL